MSIWRRQPSTRGPVRKPRAWGRGRSENCCCCALAPSGPWSRPLCGFTPNFLPARVGLAFLRAYPALRALASDQDAISQLHIRKAVSLIHPTAHRAWVTAHLLRKGFEIVITVEKRVCVRRHRARLRLKEACAQHLTIGAQLLLSAKQCRPIYARRKHVLDCQIVQNERTDNYVDNFGRGSRLPTAPLRRWPSLASLI